jgi:capsular exopolysaccharide synthesis family protein
MSKYFEETLRARNVALVPEATKLEGKRKVLEPAEGVAEEAPELSASRLKDCRRIRIPAENLLNGKFRGSKSLQPAEEAYRGLRTRLLRQHVEKGIRSVVITSAVPGEGKTHTSLNMAQYCAQLHDMRILLVDADVRSQGLTRAMGSPSGHGLSNVLSGECTPEQAVLATDNPNLYVLPAGTSDVAPAELFSSRNWQQFITWANESFKLLLVDTPPLLNLADVELITAACDGVLMVVRALHTKREILQRCAGQIDSKKLLGLVYNGADDSSFRKYSYHYYLSGDKA